MAATYVVRSSFGVLVDNSSRLHRDCWLLPLVQHICKCWWYNVCLTLKVTPALFPYILLCVFVKRWPHASAYHTMSKCTLWVKKTIHLTFDHKFGKCRPIFKIRSLTDFQGNCLCSYYMALPSHLDCVATLPCEIQKRKITDELLFIPSKLISFTWNLTKQHWDDKWIKTQAHRHFCHSLMRASSVTVCCSLWCYRSVVHCVSLLISRILF